jgi:predicted transposase YbfD/YdcC
MGGKRAGEFLFTGVFHYKPDTLLLLAAVPAETDKADVSLNACFIKWTQAFMPVAGKDNRLTLSFDGKTIRSTERMDSYDKPPQIVSAQRAELGITIRQQTVDGKSDEIPAVRELIGMLRIEGCIVVADALNCQKEMAKAIVKGNGDYLLSVKDNQPGLKQDIADYVQDDGLRNAMDTFQTSEKNRGRMEKGTAYSGCDIAWLYGKEKWAGVACIGAVNTRFSGKHGETNEWHYDIASLKRSAEELLRRIRLEWSVETTRWLLDIHFDEDYCRIADENVQQSLNMVRKIALNSIKRYQEKTKSKALIQESCLTACWIAITCSLFYALMKIVW